jgi:Uma2 family endonuclease
MGKRYELVFGELRVMSPAGWQHGMVVANVQYLLGSHIRTHRLGREFGAETGFLLTRKPDTVRAPDSAFIANEHLVEVLSPDDRKREISEKIEAWFAGGCFEVWIVDPKEQTVTIYQSPTDALVKSAGEILTSDTLMPGFSCAVNEFFA